MPTDSALEHPYGTHDVPVSRVQESLWLADRLSRRDGPAYHEPLAFQLSGTVDVDVLRAALRRVVAQHESLRTGFIEGPGGLRAVARTDVPDVLTVADLRALSPDEARRRGEDLVADCYRRPFELGSPPLLRALLVHLPGNEHLLALTAHHLVTDGFSNVVFAREIGEGYRELRAGRTAAEPVAVTREHPPGRDREMDAVKLARWKQTLNGASELLRMPLDRPRPPAQTFAGTSRVLRVPRADLAPLLDRCRRELHATDFAVFLAAYAALLHRYTGQDAVTVATTVLGRDTEDDLGAVGCFVNTAALPLAVPAQTSFRELLEHAADRAGTLLDDGDVPYPRVVEHLDVERDPSHNPVFQTMLSMLGPKPYPDLGAQVTARPLHVRREAAKFEILLYVAEDGDTVEFEAEFNTDLFDPATIERLLRHYADLLRRLPGALDEPIGTVSFIPPDEERLILDTWNDTAVAYPDSTVIDTIEEQVRRTPDAVAVEFEGETLTYDALNRRANQVARLLRERQPADAGGFVGVYMERSVELVVTLVAILKAGFAYVPIDPEYPAERVTFMIEDADLGLIVTQLRHRAALDTSGADTLVLSMDDPRTEDDTDQDRDLTPGSPCYMIYTSGSTGRPKGAVNRHDSLYNRLYWMQSAYGLTGDDKVLQKTPFSFDVSVWEFFWPLMFGARVVEARPRKVMGSPRRIMLRSPCSARALAAVLFAAAAARRFSGLPRLTMTRPGRGRRHRCGR